MRDWRDTGAGSEVVWLLRGVLRGVLLGVLRDVLQDVLRDVMLPTGYHTGYRAGSQVYRLSFLVCLFSRDFMTGCVFCAFPCVFVHIFVLFVVYSMGI